MFLKLIILFGELNKTQQDKDFNWGRWNYVKMLVN